MSGNEQRIKPDRSRQGAIACRPRIFNLDRAAAPSSQNFTDRR
jgi:hypothetical protein